MRLLALALLLLPLAACDEEDPAVAATDAANALIGDRAYNEALSAYSAILEDRPGEKVILYNRGTLQLIRFDIEKGATDLEAALDAADPAVRASAHFNLGVARYRQAIQALQTFQDALSLTKAAIAHWRQSLDIDPDQPDARYNLEMAYRLVDAINAQRVQGQRNAETRDQKTSDNRGQAFENEEDDRPTSELSDKEAPMERSDGKESGRGQTGRQGAAAPEAVNEMQEAGDRRDMTVAEAEEMLELLRQKASAAQTQHQARQQVRMRTARPEKFW